MHKRRKEDPEINAHVDRNSENLDPDVRCARVIDPKNRRSED